MGVPHVFEERKSEDFDDAREPRKADAWGRHPRPQGEVKMKTPARKRIKNQIRNRMRPKAPTASMQATASQLNCSTKTPKSLRWTFQSWRGSLQGHSSHSGHRSSYRAPLPPTSGASHFTRWRAGRTLRRTRVLMSLRVHSSQVPCYPVEMTHLQIETEVTTTLTTVGRSQESRPTTQRTSLTTATSCSG